MNALAIKNQVGISLILFLFIFTSNLFGQIRGTSWGQPKNEVLEKAKGKVVDKKTSNRLSSFATQTMIAGEPALIYYYFVDNKLASISYAYQMESNLITHYEGIKTILNNKYGKAVKDTTVWIDDTFKSDPSMHEYVISKGEMFKQTIWQNSETTIKNNLSGYEGNIKHVIWYLSKEYAPIYSEAASSEF